MHIQFLKFEFKHRNWIATL